MGGVRRADIELILCGSRQHVSIEDDCPATRMSSGSDWLHDLTAELNASVERGDHALPLSLSSADVSDQEFAARSAYDMMADYRGGPAYLQGHARVLCNFPPGRFRHRMMVATPLYVEAGQTPQARAVAASGSSSRAWRRWARSVRGWRARTSGRG
ncbi:SAVMC3_10250 family protein [Streptomyces yangpuensis]